MNQYMKATSNKAWTIFFSPIWANLGLGPKKFSFIQGSFIICFGSLVSFIQGALINRRSTLYMYPQLDEHDPISLSCFFTPGFRSLIWLQAMLRRSIKHQAYGSTVRDNPLSIHISYIYINTVDIGLITAPQTLRASE